MPCTPKKTFAVALATGNHLLVQLKENQPNLDADVRAIADRHTPSDSASSRDTGRSRQEDRTVEVFPVGKALVGSEWQPFVKTIIRVTRQTWLRSAATGMWQPRGEVSYYISSQQGLPAKTSRQDLGRHHPRPLGHREPQPLCPRRLLRRGSQPYPR
jgi:hypothetical protein